MRPNDQIKSGEPPWFRNGISVGRPKVFDNRSLTIMLGSLSDTLRGLQAINNGTVSSALGNFQGYSINDSAFGVSVSGPSLPGVTKQSEVDTAPAPITTKVTDALGNTTSVTKNDPTQTSTTTSNKSSVQQNAVTPSAPTLPNAATDLGVNVPFGQNAGDLLTDQVSLQYQIFNVRMILERAVSDRLWEGSDRKQKARRQAVLGFNISLDPPSYAADSAAVVEITIDSPATSKGDVSLVAMMPQEHSYNSAALSSKTQAFAGSAVAKAINVGVAGRRGQKLMYLYRDNDTISYENMARVSNASPLQFGWVFRPVLGRRSVSPGMRQMFVVLALPETDNHKQNVPLRVTTRTYWKRYKANTLTSYSGTQLHRLEWLREKFAATPELRSSYVDETTYEGVAVESPSTTDSFLEPKITSVDYRYTGEKTALVQLKGENFFSGTSVVLGGHTYKDTASGLILKSDSAMDIFTDVDSLIRGDGIVVGRYGSSVVIQDKDPILPNPGKDLIENASVSDVLGSSRYLEIDLNVDCEARVRVAKKKPFVLLDTYLASDAAVNCKNKKLKITAVVPDTLVKGKAPVVKVIFPFSPSRSENWQVVDSSLQFSIERINSVSSSGSNASSRGGAPKPDVNQSNKPANSSFLLKSSSTGMPFGRISDAAEPSCMRLLMGPSITVTLPNEGCEAGKAPGEITSARIDPQMILIQNVPDQALYKDQFFLEILENNDKVSGTYLVKAPAAAKTDNSSATVTIDAQIASIDQNDAVWVPITGKGLKGIASAKINGVGVETRTPPKPSKEGAADQETPASANDSNGKNPAAPESIEVFVPRAISEKSGKVDVTFYDVAGKIVGTAKISIKCVNCKTPDK